MDMGTRRHIPGLLRRDGHLGTSTAKPIRWQCIGHSAPFTPGRTYRGRAVLSTQARLHQTRLQRREVVSTQARMHEMRLQGRVVVRWPSQWTLQCCSCASIAMLQLRPRMAAMDEDTALGELATAWQQAIAEARQPMLRLLAEQGGTRRAASLAPVDMCALHIQARLHETRLQGREVLSTQARLHETRLQGTRGRQHPGAYT